MILVVNNRRPPHRAALQRSGNEDGVVTASQANTFTYSSPKKTIEIINELGNTVGIGTRSGVVGQRKKREAVLVASVEKAPDTATTRSDLEGI